VSATYPRIAEWLPPALLTPAEADGTAPLTALLRAVDEQRRLLERDIDSLWDDFFIESCAEWAIPYIAELVGAPADASRREVAYAIALRRRKGTPAALEDFVFVLTDWTARAVEGWQVTTWTQRLTGIHSRRPAALDFRNRRSARLYTPFEHVARSVTPSGRWTPRTATAVVWPWHLRTYRRTQAQLLNNRRYALHPFGLDAPLYVQPRRRRIASDADGQPVRRRGDELDAPVRATYEVLEALATPNGGEVTYGAQWTLGADHPLASPPGSTEPPLLSLFSGSDPIPWDALQFGAVPASPPPASKKVVVDLARGRVELGSSWSGDVRATWHRPVSGALGALAAEARREIGARIVVAVRPNEPEGVTVPTIEKAFKRALTLMAGMAPDETAPVDVEIRLETSDRLPAPPALTGNPPLKRWRIVAPTLMTPVVGGDLTIDIEGVEIALDGFMLDGDLRLGKHIEAARIDGLTMNPAGGRTLEVEDGAWALDLSARRSILAPIRADLAAAPIRLVDCIVDGRGRALDPCGSGGTAPTQRDAVARLTRFGPVIAADGVTFVGRVRAEAIDAADSLFVDGLEVVQQQEGCLRHCYVGPKEAPTAPHPAEYRCVSEPLPKFVSESLEAGGYYALDLAKEQPLLTAASDGGEIGVYHHARRATRLRRLRDRIHEFVPLGLRPGIALAPWEER
jgi:hypothetical protein